MNRLFLYSGLLFILILIFDAYDRDYNQPEIEISQSETTRSIDESAKQPPKGTINSNTLVDTIKSTRKDIKTLENRRLLVNFDTKSGELLFSKLKNYPIQLGSIDNVVILDHDKKRYTAASNIQVKDEETSPIYKVVEKSNDGVKLSATNIPNIIFTKEIQLMEDSHQLLVTNSVFNNTNQNIYVRIMRLSHEITIAPQA